MTENDLLHLLSAWMVENLIGKKPESLEEIYLFNGTSDLLIKINDVETSWCSGEKLEKLKIKLFE